MNQRGIPQPSVQQVPQAYNPASNYQPRPHQVPSQQIQKPQQLNAAGSSNWDEYFQSSQPPVSSQQQSVYAPRGIIPNQPQQQVQPINRSQNFQQQPPQNSSKPSQFIANTAGLKVGQTNQYVSNSIPSPSESLQQSQYAPVRAQSGAYDPFADSGSTPQSNVAIRPMYSSVPSVNLQQQSSPIQSSYPSQSTVNDSRYGQNVQSSHQTNVAAFQYGQNTSQSSVAPNNYNPNPSVYNNQNTMITGVQQQSTAFPQDNVNRYVPQHQPQSQPQTLQPNVQVSQQPYGSVNNPANQQYSQRSPNQYQSPQQQPIQIAQQPANWQQNRAGNKLSVYNTFYF